MAIFELEAMVMADEDDDNGACMIPAAVDELASMFHDQHKVIPLTLAIRQLVQWERVATYYHHHGYDMFLLGCRSSCMECVGLESNANDHMKQWHDFVCNYKSRSGCA